jgi:hypothetical protein
MSPYQVGALVICLPKFGSQAERPWSIKLLVNFARILGQKKIIASYVETVEPWWKSRVRHTRKLVSILGSCNADRKNSSPLPFNSFAILFPGLLYWLIFDFIVQILVRDTLVVRYSNTAWMCPQFPVPGWDTKRRSTVGRVRYRCENRFGTHPQDENNHLAWFVYKIAIRAEEELVLWVTIYIFVRT